jgi:N-acetylglucosamine-6-phosphate deacetylase
MGDVTLLLASGLYGPDEALGPVALALRDGRIAARWWEDDRSALMARCQTLWPGEAAQLEDMRPLWLAPGLIDLHIHGAYGYDIAIGDEDDLAALARLLSHTGVTSFLPTIASASPEATAQQVERIVSVTRRHQSDTARILGIRLEGPWINPGAAGAQDPSAIRPPATNELEWLAALSGGLLRMVDFAPEEDMDGALLAGLVRLGVIPSIGHTAATYEQTLEALVGGVRHCAHLFNAMPPLHHRAPGAAGALLSTERATVEIIADGAHVHPALLQLVVRGCGAERVALVTDALAPVGLQDGEQTFAGRPVTLHNGAIRLPDGTLAGGALSLDAAVRRMVESEAASLPDALRMASATPARILGLRADYGGLDIGMAADVIALGPDGDVQRVWVGGVPVWTNGMI